MAILNMKIALITVTILKRALELKLHGFTPPSEVEHDTESRACITYYSSISDIAPFRKCVSKGFES